MWSKDRAERFDHLRAEEARRLLTDSERTELSTLFAELDAEEARALAPALERMGHEVDSLRERKARVDAASVELERIVAQQEKLLAEAHAYAELLRRRRTALVEEFRRVQESGMPASR
ncbi:MAG: hypothetical protein U0359_09610 [Byssovorax sp.]